MRGDDPCDLLVNAPWRVPGNRSGAGAPQLTGADPAATIGVPLFGDLRTSPRTRAT